MTIIFMGTPAFAVPSLQAMHETYGVDLVITQPDKPVGRKKKMQPSAVKTYAVKSKIPLLQPRKVSDIKAFITTMKPDLIITAAYGQFLPESILKTARIDTLNVHGSLLPHLRGGAPIQRAIERGDKQTGVTIMKMVKKMDAGPIYAKASTEIHDDTTASALFERLSQLGAELLKKTVPSIIDGSLQPTPQDESQVSYAPNLTREEEALDLTKPAVDLDRKIRAFDQNPGTHITVDNTRIKVLKAQLIPTDNSHKAGEVITHAKSGPVIQTKQDGLQLLMIKPAGKQAMSAKDYLNGAGRTLFKVGKVLV